MASRCLSLRTAILALGAIAVAVLLWAVERGLARHARSVGRDAEAGKPLRRFERLLAAARAGARLRLAPGGIRCAAPARRTPAHAASERDLRGRPQPSRAAQRRRDRPRQAAGDPRRRALRRRGVAEGIRRRKRWRRRHRRRRHARTRVFEGDAAGERPGAALRALRRRGGARRLQAVPRLRRAWLEGIRGGPLLRDPRDGPAGLHRREEGPDVPARGWFRPGAVGEAAHRRQGRRRRRACSPTRTAARRSRTTTRRSRSAA